jgi:putative ABC transport system permease protein
MLFLEFVLKNILQRKARSALTILGVALAVSAVVALVGIADGFERSFRELYEKRGVDLLVARAGSSEHLSSSLPQQIGEQIRKLDGVESVSAGLVDVVSFPEANVSVASLQGWEADSFLFKGLKMIDGRQLAAGDDGGVMVGTVLARNLGKKAGENLKIAEQEFVIVGIYESFNPLENGSVIMLINSLQTLMDRPNQVTGFQVVLKNVPDKKAALESIRREIEALRSPKGRLWGVAATPTADYVKNTSQIQMAHAMAWMTSAIALAIGAIGVLNTMIMSVFERTREIGILRAIGWRKSRVVRLILYESVVFSIAGALVGIFGAIVLTRALTYWPAVNGIIRGDVAPEVMVQGFVIALAVGLIGGVYPAYRGAHLLPTEALRHE